MRPLAALAALFFILGSPPALLALSPLGESPDWSRLNDFTGSTTAAEFDRLLKGVYDPHGGATAFFKWALALNEDGTVKNPVLEITTGGATGQAIRDFPFAPAPADGGDEGTPAPRFPPRYWRSRAELPPPPPATGNTMPLAGIKIALDPGHLGAEWARMEERWFVIGKSRPVMEGEMTLLVANLLSDRLRALGAEVSLVRESGEPTTARRPADFLPLARTLLAARGVANPPATYTDKADPNRFNSLQWQSEHLFFRDDIYGRARRVNTELHPDLALCLHFNAEAWGDPRRPTLVNKNHFHILINGCYGPDEIAEEDTRLEMLTKLLNGSHAEELAAANAVARAVADAAGLPPYGYTTPNAARVGPSPYVWARNLLANRLFECPVIYLEPYVMNSPDVFARVQAGDYPGERKVNGIRRRSIFREYADGVAAGLVEHFRRGK